MWRVHTECRWDAKPRAAAESRTLTRTPAALAVAACRHGRYAPAETGRSGATALTDSSERCRRDSVKHERVRIKPT